jgi:hypothetical protein
MAAATVARNDSMGGSSGVVGLGGCVGVWVWVWIVVGMRERERGKGGGGCKKSTHGGSAGSVSGGLQTKGDGIGRGWCRSERAARRLLSEFASYCLPLTRHCQFFGACRLTQFFGACRLTRF